MYRIKRKIVNVFLGEEYSATLKKIESHDYQLECLSSLCEEQSRLIVSIAIVQNDMAQSMSKIDVLNVNEDCLMVRIPVQDDEFLN